MVGVQEDMKLFCVRDASAEVFDGGRWLAVATPERNGPKEGEEEANFCVLELLYIWE